MDIANFIKKRKVIDSEIKIGKAIKIIASH